jgi:hypothetical protein
MRHSKRENGRPDRRYPFKPPKRLNFQQISPISNMEEMYMPTTNTSNPSPRVPLELGIDYRKSYARQAGKGKLKNISLTGAFLETNTLELFPADKLIITFIVSERVRKMTATVVWKNSLGCGVRFQPFNKRDTQIVDDLMYFIESTRGARRSVLDSIFRQVSVDKAEAQAQTPEEFDS